MGTSNSVEPLSKSEKELKIRPLSVRAGAQNSKHVWLTNDTRNGPKKGEMKLTLEDKPVDASWREKRCLLAAGKLSNLLEME